MSLPAVDDSFFIFSCRRWRLQRCFAGIFVWGVLAAACMTAVAQDVAVLFGTHTAGKGKGFSLSSFDEKTGALGKPEFVTEAAGPAYFVLAAKGTRLYTCNSTGFVSAYAVADGGRSLMLLNKVSSEGGDPSYVSLDRTGRYLFDANYQGGSIVAWVLKPDGSIGERTAFVQHTGAGTDPVRQKHAYAHSILVDPTNRFVLTADLGLDKLFVYKFNAKDGSLTANDPPFVSVDPGLGARHVVFHPNGKWVYLDTEMGSKIVFFHWDSAQGTLTQQQEVSMLAPDFHGVSAAAEMRVSGDGRFVYGANRYATGDGDIVVFAVNQKTGELSAIQHIDSGGMTPRNFDFDPTGRWLLVTNHGSNTAMVFRIDGKAGTLMPVGERVSVPYPFSPRFLAAQRERPR
jgi:6-phosphogluconolactonase